MNDKCLIIYDGDCKLCNWWVRFCLRHDKRDQFLFFPSQKFIESIFASGIQTFSPETVMVYSQGKWYYKSSAVLVIISRMHSPWNLLRYLKYFPLNMRNYAYDWIARNRLRFFGRNESCPVLPKKYQDRFPDPDMLQNLVD